MRETWSSDSAVQPGWLAPLVEKLGRAWCVLMHDSSLWPIHGRYECRACGREYPVPWAFGRNGHESPWRAAGGSVMTPAVVRSMRSPLLPIAVALLMMQPARIRAAEMPIASSGAAATARQSHFKAGRAYYVEAEFKKAASQFQLALVADPNDADSYYWMGLSYQSVADLGEPFGAKYRAKARLALSKAVSLAPDRPDYRRELFCFLLDGDYVRASYFKQAKDILRSVSESDPEYLWMRGQLEQAQRTNSGMSARAGRLLRAGPQVAYQVADAPVSFLCDRKTAGR
jgi:tetratricopeptide (TPR) repeat protein